MLEVVFHRLAQVGNDDKDHFARGHYFFWEWLARSVRAANKCIEAAHECIQTAHECIKTAIGIIYGIEVLLDPTPSVEESDQASPPPYTVSAFR